MGFFSFWKHEAFPRGVHPADEKGLAGSQAIEVLPLPKTLMIPLHQHTGAPCESNFKPRSLVSLGQLIGDADAFVSAKVHASAAGRVKRASPITLANGRRVQAVPLDVSGDQPEGEALKAFLFGGDWPKRGFEAYPPDLIVKRIREAGLVGLGGAAFPTHVKLTPPKDAKLDVLVVNGAECEPYLTADQRLMEEAPDPIVTGCLLTAKAIGVDRILVGIEDNKPLAIERLREAADGTGVEIKALPTKYPQGGERQLIQALLDREVPTGGLPLHVGVVVINIQTAASIAKAVIREEPMTHRIITVSGRGVNTPKNLLVPIGASYQDLVDACGGLTSDAARMVSGGPMMGFTLNRLDVPVTKGTSGLTILSHADVEREAETACVRCGRCVDVCPMNLVPTKIALAARARAWDLARSYHMHACIECGCCSFACPASIPLVQLIRMGKVTVRP